MRRKWHPSDLPSPWLGVWDDLIALFGDDIINSMVIVWDIAFAFEKGNYSKLEKWWDIFYVCDDVKDALKPLNDGVATVPEVLEL